MQIITLTTDLGLRDYYVAALKGSVLRSVPDVSIVDITHSITKFNVQEAAFMIKNCYRDFPEGTIHIAGVRTARGNNDKHLLIEKDKQFFIGSDNGIFPLIFGNEMNECTIRRMTISPDNEYQTFVTKSLYVKAAVHLAKGGKPSVLGTETKEITQAMSLQPLTDNDRIRGTIQFIDSYGNLITNISKEVYDRTSRNRPGEVNFRNPKFRIPEIRRHYDEVAEGELVALFGSSGFLEISINSGSAEKLLGMKINEPITVLFL